MDPELLLDSSIRLWVVLPIVFITFLSGVLRHHASTLLQRDREVGLEAISDSARVDCTSFPMIPFAFVVQGAEQGGEATLLEATGEVLLRSRILRENGKYLPRHSFMMRKHYFNNSETGFFKKTKRKVIPKNPLTDTGMVLDMMKGNLTNVLPMILIGGWINWAFSGFLTTKVPFPLTLRFKPMLQRGVDLLSLDASWYVTLFIFRLKPGTLVHSIISRHFYHS
uniref:ER membrane protein complex subunit 3 n=1 Tax=Neogobius melanostomus TaxID=47308 RepID=A0A8C6SE38_9GOBI